MRSYLRWPVAFTCLFSLLFLLSIFIIKNSRSGGGPVDIVSFPAIEPTSLQFPDTPVGSGLVNPQVIYIKNIGAPMTQLFVYGAYLSPYPGTDLTDFVVDYGDCLGRGIFPDQPCAVKVYFTPKSEGEKKQFIIADVPDPLGGPYSRIFYAQITLMGKGISGPANIPPPEPADRPEAERQIPPPAPVIPQPAPSSPPPPAPVVGYSSPEEDVAPNQVSGGCMLQVFSPFNYVSIVFPLSFIALLSWLRVSDRSKTKTLT